VAEPLAGEGLQRALLAGGLRRDTLCELDREDSDDRVDEPAGDVPGTGETFEERGADETAGFMATVVFTPPSSP